MCVCVCVSKTERERTVHVQHKEREERQTDRQRIFSNQSLHIPTHTQAHTQASACTRMHLPPHPPSPSIPNPPPLNFSHLRKTREHASHGLVVQTFRAVDDNDIHAQRLAQILGGLCFACASRSLGAAAAMEVEGSGEGHVTAVSEGSDDQTARVTQVLVAVLELGVGLLHHAVVVFLKQQSGAMVRGHLCDRINISH